MITRSRKNHVYFLSSSIPVQSGHPQASSYSQNITVKLSTLGQIPAAVSSVLPSVDLLLQTASGNCNHFWFSVMAEHFPSCLVQHSSMLLHTSVVRPAHRSPVLLVRNLSYWCHCLHLRCWYSRRHNRGLIRRCWFSRCKVFMCVPPLRATAKDSSCWCWCERLPRWCCEYEGLSKHGTQCLN